jgi:toxin ParE1/3/4
VRLELSESAIADIRSISRYTSQNWGRVQEEKYLEALWVQLQSISEKPDSYRLRNDLFPECRIAPCGSHLILFRVRNQTVQVARVLHRSMDFARHIPDYFQRGA